MDRKVIRKKESDRNKEVRLYFNAKNQRVEHSGETVQDFLARGGTIKKIENSYIPKRDYEGRFLKADSSIGIIQ